MPKRISKIEHLSPDPHNANRGTVQGAGMVEDSLREYGAGRSILTDKNGVVIAGNKTMEQAKALGIPVQAVHTTGDRQQLKTSRSRTTAPPRSGWIGMPLHWSSLRKPRVWISQRSGRMTRSARC